MTHEAKQEAGSRGDTAHGGRWSNGTTFLLTSCGVVATAAYLGASWLRTPIAGLPAGVWSLAIAQTAGYAWHRRQLRLRSSVQSLRAAPGLPASRWNLEDVDVRLLAGRAIAASIDCLESVARRLPWEVDAIPDTTRLCQKLDRLSSPAAPLRIGLDVGPDAARALVAQESSHPVEWVAVPSGQDDQTLLRKLRLDCLVRHDVADTLSIVTPERAGSECSWFDWSQPRPLSFASIFPAQLDPAQVTIESIDFTNAPDARIASNLIRAVAMFSRAPHRLDFNDRLRGRRPSLGFASGPRAATTFWPAEDCMLEMVQAVEDGAREGWDTPAWRVAARVCSAWAASTDAPLDIETRKRCLDACCRIITDEPEVQLRAMAMRFAAWDDRTAFESLARADRLLRSREAEGLSDQLPFLQSELEMGLPGPFTLGRVAAGIALACATSPLERFAHIRGDVLDDMRYSSWLVGRDQDRAVLVEVFKVLERERSQAGPYSQAA